MTIKYPESNVVSIWIGFFTTETEFDTALDTSVVPRLGINVPISSICETEFRDKPVSLAELLEGFSGWETFTESALERARELGLTAANAVLVCYYLRCDDAPKNWERLTFLGTFNGQDVT